MQLHTKDNQLILTLLKEEKIESRGHNILRKQQILCNTKEIEKPKDYFSLFFIIQYFQMYHVVTTENEKTETNPFTYAEVASTSSSTVGR